MSTLTVTSGEARIDAQTFGDAADPTLVLASGAGSSRDAWHVSLCERLAAAGLHVVRYDHRDSGGSTSYPAGQPGYALRDLVEDLVAVIATTSSTGRAHVWGLSMGGAIGQLVALDHPERLDRLVLQACSPGGPGHEATDLPGWSPALQDAFSSEEEPDLSSRASAVEALVDGERPFAGPDGIDEEALRATAAATVERTRDLDALMSNHFRADAGAPWRDRLGSITAPTLVVHGTHDPFFPVEHGRALAAEVPGAEIVELDRVGHEYPPRRTWDTLVPRVTEHLLTTARRTS